MINFDWISIDALSKDELRSFCSSDEECEFCWWVVSDIGESARTYKDIMECIEKAKLGSTAVWRGNTHVLNFYPEKVILSHTMKLYAFEYILSEFKILLESWKSEWVKRGCVFSCEL